jgi:hypothetical protein
LTDNHFFALAEQLWSTWLAEELRVSPFVGSQFDLDASPEPYLIFSADANPLVVLTTNPGATMPHQLRGRIVSGQGVARASEPYSAAARRLAEWYRCELSGAARTRLDAMLNLAEAAGYSGAIQVELCPLHSASFPRKSQYVAAIAADPLLGWYVEALRAFLRDRPVLAVSAVSSRRPPDQESVAGSTWLGWKADVMGLDYHRTDLVPLVENAGGVTCAALVDRGGQAPKAMVLMMGGNHLPGPHGASRLAKNLRMKEPL